MPNHLRLIYFVGLMLLSGVVAQEKSKPLIVTWYEFDELSFNIYVKRWTGESWEALGEALDIQAYRPASLPNAALDNFGQPLVSWSEDNTSANTYVKRWNGTSWERLGDAVDIHTRTLSTYSNLIVTRSGQPVVSWEEADSTLNYISSIYVKRWNGQAWEQLGDALDNEKDDDARMPYLTLDSTGQVVISWSEFGVSEAHIFLKRWDGRQWLEFVSPLDLGDSFFPTLTRVAFDGDNQPIMAWSQCALIVNERCVNFNVNVAKWQQDHWQRLGEALDINVAQDAYNVSLVVDGKGQPIVTWNEFAGISYDIHVKQWDGSRWQSLGNFLDNDVNLDAYSPSLILDDSGQPVVAWW